LFPGLDHFLSNRLNAGLPFQCLDVTPFLLQVLVHLV
jgi:hypothetical protein